MTRLIILNDNFFGRKSQDFSFGISDWYIFKFQFIQLRFLKVHFCQNVLMFLSYLQTEEHFTFLNLKIQIFKAALASQMQPSCPYKPLSFQTLSNFQSPKFKFSTWFRKIKYSSVWRYDKYASILWQKCIFIRLHKYFGSIVLSFLTIFWWPAVSYFLNRSDKGERECNNWMSAPLWKKGNIYRVK